jgi:hypothetical protein
MNKFLQVFVCLFFIATGCTSGITKNEVQSNKQIDPKIKAEASVITNQVYSLMSENNYDDLSKLFSDTLLEYINSDFAQKFMPNVQKVIKGKKYWVFDEFYARNVKPVDTINISSGSGDNAYKIKILSAANETYVSMLVAGDSINEVMLTIILNKIKGKWKVSNIRGEDYSLRGKNAIAQYRYAQALGASGALIDAVNIMGLSSYCSAPGGSTFVYTKTSEIKRYADSLTGIAKAKYPFPYTVNELTTKPLIVNIHYERMDSTLVPMIIYQSSIPVADTVSLKKENTAMQEQIGNIFEGMDKNNKILLYRAYNELPDGKNNPRYYGYVQKMKR